LSGISASFKAASASSLLLASFTEPYVEGLFVEMLANSGSS